MYTICAMHKLIYADVVARGVTELSLVPAGHDVMGFAYLFVSMLEKSLKSLVLTIQALEKGEVLESS